MTDLDRRQLLGGAAAAGAAAALSSFPASTAGAAVPPSGTQAPGFYRYKVGSFECTSINDGARSFPMPDTFVKNVSKEEALAAAEAAYMPKGMVTVPFNPQLINTGGKLVLIDCGNGIANLEPSKGAVGRTLQNLAAAAPPSSWRRSRSIMANTPPVAVIPHSFAPQMFSRCRKNASPANQGSARYQPLLGLIRNFSPVERLLKTAMLESCSVSCSDTTCV